MRQSQDPIRSFNSAASNRVVTKSTGLIYKGFGLQATTLPFPRRDPPTTKSQCTAAPAKGFAFTYATVQFPRDVSISVGRCTPFRCIQFRETPFIPSPFRDTYRPILLFSIRWWINPSYPKNYHAVYDCCIRFRRKLRLPVVMKNDLWRNHIARARPFSAEETLT